MFHFTPSQEQTETFVYELYNMPYNVPISTCNDPGSICNSL